MIWGTLAKYGDTCSAKTITSLLMLVVATLSVMSIDSLTEDHTRISESERDAQNTIASALYINLAALAQPITTSDITPMLLDFIRQDERVRGTTLLDSSGELIAQLGSGNDGLVQHPTHMPTARIPIRSANNGLYGHVVIAFRPAKDKLNETFHYVAITAISTMLTLALSGLLYMHWKLLRSLIRRTRIHRKPCDKHLT